MKKLRFLLMLIALAAVVNVAASDVPEPSVPEVGADTTVVTKKLGFIKRMKESAERHGWTNMDSIASKGKFANFSVKAYRWVDHAFNFYDSTYVVGCGYPWKVTARNDNWFDSYKFYLESDEDHVLPVTWSSNWSSMMGFTVAFMAVSFGYSFDFSRMHDNAKVQRRVFDFDFCSSRVAASLKYIRNQNRIEYLKDEIKDDPEAARILDEVKTTGVKNNIWIGNVYYFFNNKRYSQSAAYNFSKIQRRSAGSPVVGLSFFLNDVYANLEDPDDVLPTYLGDMRVDWKEMQNLHLKSNSFTVIGGYGYNWVPCKNLVLNATLLPSIGWRYGHQTSGNGEEGHTYDVHAYSFAVNLRARAAVTYNFNRHWFGSIFCDLNRELYHRKGYTFNASVGKMGAYVGFRF